MPYFVGSMRGGGWSELFHNYPSATKLLVTKNDSETMIFAKVTNFTRNSLKSFFEGAKSSNFAQKKLRESCL